MHDAAHEKGKPWYREPWPWLLIAGPGAVVVASFYTLYLAIASADGLVDGDYYKDGLAINRVLAREDAAERLGMAARVDPEGGRLRVRLQGRAALPGSLQVRFAHATRAGYDRSLVLARAADGSYRAALPALAPGHWRIFIEDPRGQWRLAGEWLGGTRPFLLVARTEEAQ
ncbi:MAG TPA: FixH family protein [Burkholderiales bacterium]|nr:FixH family protein [Burkholderiales bacterium]